MWNPAEHTDQENLLWCWLRAIEWGRWPLFVSQVFAPLCLLFCPWYCVVIVFFAANIGWTTIRYEFISVGLADAVADAMILKWPITIGSAIFLFSQGSIGVGILALCWPIVAVLLGTVTPTQVGRIQTVMIGQLGYERTAEIMGCSEEIPSSQRRIPSGSTAPRCALLPDDEHAHLTRYEELLAEFIAAFQTISDESSAKEATRILAGRVDEYVALADRLWYRLKALMAAATATSDTIERFNRLPGGVPEWAENLPKRFSAEVEELHRRLTLPMMRLQQELQRVQLDVPEATEHIQSFFANLASARGLQIPNHTRYADT